MNLVARILSDILAIISSNFSAPKKSEFAIRRHIKFEGGRIAITISSILPLCKRPSLISNHLNGFIFSNNVLLAIITTVLVVTGSIFFVVLELPVIYKISNFFSSSLSILQVAYAQETLEIGSNKVDSAIQNEKRANDLIDEMDGKAKPNQNHNEVQAGVDDFNNLKVSSRKLRDNTGGFNNENRTQREHDNNNNKDSQPVSPTRENKIQESVQFCDSGSSNSIDTSSRSCSENRYCKSVSYSKVIKCTRTSSHNSNNAMRVNAGPDQVVRSGQKVTLNGREGLYVNGADGNDGYTFSWAQLFPRQPVIKLSDKHIVSPTFEAPIVSHDTIFVFQLTMKDDQFEAADRVEVLVGRSDETGSSTAYNPSRIQITSNPQHEIQVEQIHEKPTNKMVIDQEKTSVNVQKINDSNGTVIGRDKLDRVNKEPYNSKNDDDSINMTCSGDGIIIDRSTQGLITCSIHNESSFPIEMQLKCSGLEGTGIQCFIDHHFESSLIVVKEMSTKTFPVVAITPFIHGGKVELYPFTISAN